MNRRKFVTVAALATLPARQCPAVEAPADFVEIPWGASQAEAHQIMMKRPGVRQTGETPLQLFYSGGTFAGEIVAGWRLEFKDSRFSSGAVSFTPIWGRDGKGLLIDQLESRIREQVDKKYGKAKKKETPDHREYNWKIVDKLRPKRAKTIRLFHGWKETRLVELVYSDASAEPIDPKEKGDI